MDDAAQHANDTPATRAAGDCAPATDMFVIIGTLLRAASNALATIHNARAGSLRERRLTSVILFFIHAILRALVADATVERSPRRRMNMPDRALVAAPSRWAAP